jgi:protein TonB
MAPQNRDAVDRLQRGLVIALVAILGILIIVLASRLLRGNTELLGPLSDTTAPAADGSAPSGDVAQRLAAARSAMGESRLVAPAGNNAYEHYLAVLAQQPDNVSAREALNDLYGIAVSSAEQAIAANDFDDAERLADLLGRSNPNSFTVVNLRQRIERGQAAQQAAANAQQQAQQAAATRANAPAAAPPAAEPETPVASATPEPATPTPAPTETPAPATQAPATRTVTTTAAAPASRPAAPAVREARLLSRVDPEYPREAMRSRQQGWVEVEFTIGRDGTVSDVQVVASRPSRVFDRAAQQAISGWRFEPRSENGQPVASRLRQRFDFRLD